MEHNFNLKWAECEVHPRRLDLAPSRRHSLILNFFLIVHFESIQIF